MPWDLSETIVFRGDPVAWGASGPQDAPPLVLVHGTPWSSWNWRRVIEAFEPTHRVHYFDLLGYGRSAKRDGQDVSLGVQNELLAALFDHWNFDAPPLVVGHDFGGATVLRGWILNGLRYRKLALFNIVAVSPWGSPFGLHVKKHEAAFAGIPAYMHEAMVRAYIRTAMHTEKSDDELAPIVAPWLGEDGQPAFYRQIGQWDERFTDEVQDLYRDIDCPVHIFWGDADTWIPIERGRKLHGLMPGAGFTPIPGAGHLVQEDTPGLLIENLKSFLLD